jgi:hypothetical protein
MPIGTLRAYGLPMSVTGNRTEHTYVESSNGHKWPCHGRSSGGRLICTGTGNTAEADCLAQPGGSAGILYAITGMCHQTANRILSPSGQTVFGALGYNNRGTLFAYGAYGLNLRTFPPQHYHPRRNPWPELHTCRTTHTHP